MLVIGLGHKAQHGKDTVAQTIIEQRGDQYDIRQYSFAKALKNEVKKAVEDLMADNNLSISAPRAMEYLCAWASSHPVRNPATGKKEFVFVPYDPSPSISDPLSPYGKQVRLLQWWGTEYRRWEDPNYWVRQVQDVILADQPQVALITDVRFPNEFWWVKDKMEGETVDVERVGFVDMTRDPNHPSETALDNYAFDHKIIVPDGQLEELKRDAVELFDIIAAASVPGPTQEEINRMGEEADAESEAVQA